MSKLSRKLRRMRQAMQERAGLTYELDGCRFSLPAWADDVKRNIRRGTYEAAERRLVGRWIRGDRPVVELGAAFGIVSAVVARRLADGVRHVLVEADRRIAGFAFRNAAAQRPVGAPVHQIDAAIAYGLTEARFLASDGFLGSRLASPGEANSVSVPATTLSGVVLEQLGATGDYDLVCDIEGAELDVFSRDQGVLGRCRTALVEIHPMSFAARGSSEEEFLELIAAAGFHVVDRDDNVLACLNSAVDTRSA